MLAGQGGGAGAQKIGKHEEAGHGIVEEKGRGAELTDSQGWGTDHTSQRKGDCFMGTRGH